MSEAVLSFITAVVTAAVTWFFSRRKTNAEAKTAEIDANKTLAQFYQGLLDDAARRIDQQIALGDARDKRIESLMTAVKERDEQIRVLLSKLTERDTQIEHLIKEVESLTDQLKRYKQLTGKIN